VTAAPQIKAIETWYAGHRFRSRTEARWAVFFTNLRLRWEYERQGFLVGDEQRPYLPDFYLPDLGLWLEIKPVQAPNVDDLEHRPLGLRNWEDFAAQVATEWDHDKTAMLVGPIPDPADVDKSGPPQAGRWYDPGIVILGDWHYAWCACPSGRHFDIQFEARSGRIECGCPRVLDGRLQSGNHAAILNAYATARSARFEHGERA
jgi:hypothetical protein